MYVRCCFQLRIHVEICFRNFSWKTKASTLLLKKIRSDNQLYDVTGILLHMTNTEFKKLLGHGLTFKYMRLSYKKKNIFAIF